MVGRSQLPALAVVLENGRREIEVALLGQRVVFEEVEERAVDSGRREVEAMESFWN
jgi:hypothetical protein